MSFKNLGFEKSSIERQRKEVKKDKLEFQNLESILIEEAKRENPDYQTAMNVAVDEEESFEKVKEKAKKELKDENWWFQEYWKEKGMPKEQISIQINENKIDIYNWNKPINEEQLNIIQDTLKKFAQISKGEALKKIRYFLIDNVSKTHYYTGKEMNGDASGSEFDQSIKLFPKAFQNTEHRVNGVSNLEGTLIHELSHKITPKIINEWIEKFEWRMLDKGKKTPGRTLSYWEIKNPSHCITEHAQYTPQEDICDSMIAALKNPKILDTERLKIIRKKLLEPTFKKKVFINTKILSENEIILPKIKSPVKIKRIGGIKIYTDK